MEITKEMLEIAAVKANHEQLRVMYEAAKTERDALAAQLVAIQDAALKPRGKTRQQWIDNIKRNVFDITAREHLRELRAEAGRAGYLQGIADYQQAEAEYKDFWIDTAANQYAEQIRQEGK